MSRNRAGQPRITSEWLAAALVATIAAATYLSFGAFNRDFTPVVRVTLTAPRSGLVMEPNAKVKMRGVQIGRVATIAGGSHPVSLTLEIDPEQIQFIPANVRAGISASTLFGGKFVEFEYPDDPSPQRLSAGSVLTSDNVAVEVNTVFQNLVELLKQVDPAKLNAILAALADGLGGRGDAIGKSIGDTNQILAELNSRTDILREDWQALAATADTYSAAAPHLINTLAAATTTTATITDHSRQLDALLLNVSGFAQSGTALLGPNKNNLENAVNTLQPTTDLLLKYNPELTCMLVGAENVIPDLAAAGGGANGKSVIMDAAILLGDEPYKYPDNLPIVGAKGGPGGEPGCGSLPDVAKNWPQRYLVTDTGYGTGLDVRPNPGIGFPGYVDYLPVTRAVPEPPSIRHEGPPAPGPAVAPDQPPYGAPWYGADGIPLYPGVPPAPPPADPGQEPVAPPSP